MVAYSKEAKIFAAAIKEGKSIMVGRMATIDTIYEDFRFYNERMREAIEAGKKADRDDEKQRSKMLHNSAWEIASLCHLVKSSFGSDLGLSSDAESTIKMSDKELFDFCDRYNRLRHEAKMFLRQTE